MEPLLCENGLVESPIDQALGLLAAELLQQWHYASPIVKGCGEHVDRGRLPWEVPMDDDALKQRCKLVNSLIAVHREMRKR